MRGLLLVASAAGGTASGGLRIGSAAGRRGGGVYVGVPTDQILQHGKIPPIYGSSVECVGGRFAENQP